MSEDSEPKWLSYIDPELLDAFVDNPYECPIVIDKNGIVRFMSRYNVGLYGLTPEQSVGKHITEINKNSRMHETLITGKPQIGETYQLGNRQQIVARIPIRNRKGEILGVLGKRMFHRIDTIGNIYHQLDVLKGQIKYYRKEATSKVSKIIGNSEYIQEMKKNALQAANTDASVLVTGESGTGKEACAFYIHHSSRRADGPFIKVNCAAVPSELIESELFGYVGGAFTGARPQGKLGKFELANKGTILLDEIGDMPLGMQAKLLRVLQEYEIERIGGSKPTKVDFRLIASTNKDLQEMIKKGSFRMDLYYRINIFNINTPSLRSIPDDIPEITAFLIDELSKKTNKTPKTCNREAMNALQNYQWPGNVRELKNVIERAMIIAEGREIQLHHLPLGIVGSDKKAENASLYIPFLRNSVAEAEKKAITKALAFTKGNKVKTAQILGIHRTVLYQKIKRYEIHV
jgi:transcriptional regulator with PAS, ATPase and Fis domain